MNVLYLRGAFIFLWQMYWNHESKIWRERNALGICSLILTFIYSLFFKSSFVPSHWAPVYLLYLSCGGAAGNELLHCPNCVRPSLVTWAVLSPPGLHSEDGPLGRWPKHKWRCSSKSQMGEKSHTQPFPNATGIQNRRLKNCSAWLCRAAVFQLGHCGPI